MLRTNRMKYHQIIYSKNSLFCGVGKSFKLYFMHKVMLSFDTLHVHVGKKDVIMNWHGTVDERTWNDKFEGDVLDETLNIFLYQQMTRPGWQHTSHVAVGPMERFSPSET